MSRTAIALGCLAALTAACGFPSASPTAPPALTAVTAALSFSNLTASVEPSSSSSGFVYHVALHVNETSGKSGAKFTSVEVVFPDGRGSVATLAAMVSLPAGGGQDIATFDVPDPTGTTPEPQLSVRLDFADDSGRIGVATSGPAPVTVLQRFVLVGYVRDAVSGQGVVGATVQVTSGLDNGQSATTNQDGYYAFGVLRSGTFTILVSASGYVSTTQSVRLASNAEVDVTLASAPVVGTSRVVQR